MAFVDYDAMKQCGSLERQKLEQLFKQLDIKEYTLTSNGKSICYDGIIHKPDHNIYVEVKVRRNTSTKYPDYLLQQDKFDNIHKKFLNPKDRMLYINFFSDNIAIVFNINERADLYITDTAHPNYPYTKKRLPAYTCGSRIFVEKEIVMLAYDENIDIKVEMPT